MALVMKNPLAKTEDMRQEFDPWVAKIPWRKAWQPSPVFLPGEHHGQRSLVGFSPRGHKESDTTGHLTLSTLSLPFHYAMIQIGLKNSYIC